MPRIRRKLSPALLGASLLLLILTGLAPSGLSAQSTSLSVSNQSMSARLSGQHLKPELIWTDLATGSTLSAPELFRITLRDGSTLKPSQLHWDSTYARSPWAGARKTGNEIGKKICASLSDQHTGAKFQWCLLDPVHRRYMREQLTIRASAQALPITEVLLIKSHDPGARVIGSVKGSPLADQHMFFGFEQPLAWSRISDGVAESGITRVLPLRAHQSVTYSAVVGTYQPGQMRRAFLAYLEAVRPRPYAPFLNYNTWFDIGYGNRYNEAEVLNRIHAYGEQLVTKRHVKLNSFVFDDGWDNPNSFWGFDSGFPDGFTRVARAAASYGAGIGVWLSPWGGYDEQKTERIAYGKAHGFEIVHNGYALSGPKYFRGFSQVCSEMISKYHANLFKFDGTGNADSVFPGSAFDSDFAAAIHLIHHLRRQEPGIYINLTTGTYPSPFWLLYADSIWRGGDDHSFAGVGSSRQRWITYRDEQTYRNIVLKGPLFPLNSLMLHGMIYAKQAQGLRTDPDHDFPDEVLSYFGSGTQLQEMYITPSLLSKSDWDILARAAKWSRAHAGILEDTHWIGGDPGKLQIYGWAAWNPSGWIITLRNPSDHAQEFSLHLTSTLQLPTGAATDFAVRKPFASSSSATMEWKAGNTISLHLKPFEVRIYEGSSEPEAHADMSAK